MVGAEGNRFRYRILDHNGWTICPVCFCRLRSRSVWKGSDSPYLRRASHHSIPIHLGPGGTTAPNLLAHSSTMFWGCAPRGNQKIELELPRFMIRSLRTVCTAPATCRQC